MSAESIPQSKHKGGILPPLLFNLTLQNLTQKTMKSYQLSEGKVVITFPNGIDENHPQYTISDGLVVRSNHDVSQLEPALLGSGEVGHIINAVIIAPTIVTNPETLTALMEAVDLKQLSST